MPSLVNSVHRPLRRDRGEAASQDRVRRVRPIASAHVVDIADRLKTA
jgi:hypothetical protein